MAKLLKDLYNSQYILTLANSIKKHYDDFDIELFETKVFDDTWSKKELKQRMRHISSTLKDFLPSSYERSINILIDTFNDMNHDYYLENIIFQDYVEVFGLDEFSVSMRALESFTVKCTSEFAIRQFILKYPQPTMKQMHVWALSVNEHHRRLSSEGCRPRLPWAIALSEFKKDASEIVKILELLKDDESAYVRKSVANNLNDISKDNPSLVKRIAKKWLGESDETDKLVKHACRTLLKQSDREILSLFGFRETENISLDDFKITQKVEWGGEVEFSFELSSKNSLGKLRVEYIMEFLRQNKKYSKKVFKISEGSYNKKSKFILKKHSFKKISTRKYYSGIQKLSIVINGKIYAKIDFILLNE